MASQAAAGSNLLEAGKYDEAIEKYTAAIAVNPSSPDYYIKRSTAYQRKKPADYAAALQDAEIAVVAATARARRELIAQAQMRRAIALFCLERYGDAKFVLERVKELDAKEKSVPMWELKVQQKLKGLENGDEKAKVNVDKVPQVSIPEPAGAKPGTPVTTSSTNNAAATLTPAPIQPTPAGKIKHDWYQSNDKIHLTIMAKGVDSGKVVVDIQPSSLNVSFPTGSDQEYNLSLDPLYALIDRATSFHKFSSTKLEFTLIKMVSGQWAKLEGDGSAAPATTNSDATEAANVKKAVLAAGAAPSYPSSSKSGPKNWDKLASEIVDADDGGDDVNKFFQTLYKGADADTQRAMMKSYQESNGTVLSTNWSEVGKGKVETAPPDGMTAKQWNE